MKAAKSWTEAQIIAQQKRIQGLLKPLSPTRPIFSQHTIAKGSWHECPHDIRIELRATIPRELVFDFDEDDWTTLGPQAEKLIKWLDEHNVPHWKAFTGGHGIHVQIFLDGSKWELSESVGDDVKKFNLQLPKLTRELLFEMIIKEAGLDPNGLDPLKVGWSEVNKGSLLREFGCLREDGGVKTLIATIPKTRPKPGELPLVFPDEVRLWDISDYIPRLNDALESLLKACRERKTVTLEYHGEPDDYPCFNDLMRGREDGQRTRGAYHLSTILYASGKPIEDARNALALFASRCEDAGAERERKCLDTVESVYRIGYKISCEKIIKDHGNAVCNESECKRYLECHPTKNPSKDDHKSSGGRGHSSDIILATARSHGLKLYKDASSRAYASYRIDGHSEISPVESEKFAKWLTYICYAETKRCIPREGLNEAVRTMKALATFEGEEIALGLRVARYDGSLWYDLGDKNWRVVRIHPDIKPNGWEITEAPVPLFWRAEDMMPVPEPIPGENADAFWGLLNLPSNADLKLLFRCHVISFLIAGIAKAIMSLHGQKGGAKTDTAVRTKMLIDPADQYKHDLTDPRNINNILEEHYITVLDNVSNLKRETSNKMCRSVDGETSADRKLCTNREQERYKYQRCIVTTSVEVIGADFTDLAQRTCLYQPPFINRASRTPEAELEEKFSACKAEALGYFLTIVSKAMRQYEEMKKELHGELPRLADFCIWGEAISRAMGNENGEFTKAYLDNINVGIEENINANALAQAILKLLDGQETVGGYAAPAGRTYQALAKIASDFSIDTKGEDWPRQPNKLSGKMSHIVEDLLEIGITFEKKKASDLTEKELEMLKGTTGETVSKGATAKEDEVQRGQQVFIFKRSEKASEDTSDTTNGENVMMKDPKSEVHHNTAASQSENADLLRWYDKPPHAANDSDAIGYEALLEGIALCHKRAAYFEKLDPLNKGRIRVLMQRGKIGETGDGRLFVC